MNRSIPYQQPFLFFTDSRALEYGTEENYFPFLCALLLFHVTSRQLGTDENGDVVVFIPSNIISALKRSHEFIPLSYIGFR